MIEIVNAVASGHLGQELELSHLSTDIVAQNVHYNPDEFPGVQMRFEKDGPVLIVYSTGAYVIMGAKNKPQIGRIYENFISSLRNLDIETDPNEPQVKNLICKSDLDREVDLDTLILGLGIEQVEYEPEQSPFVYYWPENIDCLITIPANGQVIVTGVTDVKEAEKAVNFLREKINSIFG